MLVTRKSQFTGKVNTLDLNVTQAQLDAYASRQGHIQDIFPHLSPDEREFLMTGATPEEWNAIFGDEEDE